MQRRRAGLLAVLVSAALVAWRYAVLLLPGRALFCRDIPHFHAPLRHDLWRLLGAGELPRWNPWLNGGQPLLSNPNYAAFYPPTWLGLLVDNGGGLELLAALHGVWGLLGSWRLVRALGGGPIAAAMAACGFAAGVLPGVIGFFNFFTAASWMPWTLLCGWRALAPRADSSDQLRFGAATALCLAMQLLAGEPVAVLLSAVALAVLVASRRDRLRSLGRCAAIALFAAGLAAVQLLPTWQRLADSPRADGIGVGEATLWSLPPARLGELLLPRLFGDPNRDEESLYFGWTLHDRAYPYVATLYTGLLLAVVGLTGWRSRWLWVGIAGTFFALGRHNPLYALLHEHLPLVDLVRYPEKVALLLPFGLAIAGALGWERWSDRRLPDGQRRLAVGLTAVVALGTISSLVVLRLRPDLGERFVLANSGTPLPPPILERAVAFLEGQALLATMMAFALLGLLLLASSRRPSRRLLDGAALLLLATDISIYGHGFVATLPEEAIPAATPLLEAGERLYSPTRQGSDVGGSVVVEHPGFQQLIDRRERLDPYAANLLEVGYVLNGDYDLMLTGWARHAERMLAEHAADPARRDSILAAWSVAAEVRPRPLRELLVEARRQRRRPAPGEILRHPTPPPWLRTVPRATIHSDLRDAVTAAASAGFRTWEHEHCASLELPPASASYPAAADLRPHQLGGADLDVGVASPSGAFLVAAITYDDGWEAMLDGRPVPICPTALGQIGVPVPPGEHRLVLSYRDPWVPVGGTITLLSLLGGALVILRQRPR